MATIKSNQSNSGTSAKGVALRLGAELLEGIARKYGTPCYVYNGNQIIDMYTSLQKLIEYPKLKIFYAMKANYSPRILTLLRDHGAYLDTVSLGDVLLALECGYTPDRLLNTANNLTDAEMKSVRELGVLMNIGELSLLERYGKAFPNTAVCLRFNPEVIAGEFVQIQTAGVLSKFGILVEDLSKAKEIVSRYGLKVVGLHSHTGSGIADIEKYFESMRKIGVLATKENFPDLRFIDYGGGFKVPYKPDEARIDYIQFGKGLTNIFASICERYGRELELYFEPGKYIVAESGYLLIEANNIRNNRGRLLVGTNSGFPQLIRPVFYEAYHHIVNITNPNGQPMIYDIGGNICEGGDFFAKDRKLAEVRVSDVLAIENAGAYCYAMGGVYNLRPMPAEVMVLNNLPKLIRKALTTEELVAQIMRESI